MVQPGDLILNGKYRIEELAGKGAFAEVYRATHLELNVPRAIKVLRVDAPGVGSTTFNDYRARYRQEFQIAARIDHPNVIKVYDLVEEQGVLYAVLEYATGGSVKDLLAKPGALPIDRVIQILLDCAAGLDALHEKLGVIHRDIKPSNILLDADGRAKIADLGLAQVGGGSSSMRSELGSEAGMHPGTALYRSPEHNSWEPLTPTSDVYSLGCVAFEMLTSQVWKQAMHKVTCVHDLRFDCPALLDVIVMRMLFDTPGLRMTDADNSQKRFVTMGAVTRVVREQPDAEPSVHPKPAWLASPLVPSKPTQDPTSLTRRRALGCVGAMLVLGLILLGVFMLTQRGMTVTIFTPSAVPLTVIADATRIPTFASTAVPPTLVSTTITPIATLPERVIVVTATPVPSPTPTDTPRASATPTLSTDNAPMVIVPAVEFIMGNSDFGPEIPPHSVTLDAYWMDKFEVTNALYKKCVDGGKCRFPSSTKSYTRDAYFGSATYNNYPVIYVSYDQAKAYCEWVGKRLPTEAEWENAARGTDQRLYPWGSMFDKNLLNSGEGAKGDTTTVGSYPGGASPYGILDMAGNVSEWVADWYGKYPSEPQRNPAGPSYGQYRVMRGGAWISASDLTRSTSRNEHYPPYYTEGTVGFRCARSQ